MAVAAGAVAFGRVGTGADAVEEGPPPWDPAQPLASRLAHARTHPLFSARLPSDGTAVQTGFAAALVTTELAAVASAIHDVDRYHELLPQVVQSRELRRTARVQDAFVRISVAPLPEFWARLRFRDRRSDDGVLEIEGRALEGNLEQFRLRWRLTPVDEGRAALVELWALVLPSLPIPLPPGLLSREQERTAARGVAAVRTRFAASSETTRR